jgi:hypothetical protein
MKAKPYKIVYPKEFEVNEKWGKSFVFPFEPLDLPDRLDSLGRIEWHIELVMDKKKSKVSKSFSKYYIKELWVFATQTRDKRYIGKIFKIPCHTETLTASSFHPEDYLNNLWKFTFCDVHKNPLFSAYPKDEHKYFVIDASSSISIEPKFMSKLPVKDVLHKS